VVLLMMSVLDDTTAKTAMAEARRLRMDAIVEVHDEAELSRALALGASIVGINNRDLKTMAVDLAVTERLARLVPDDVLVVAESGIRSHADVRRLSRHADAFLVGSSLMAAPDIVEAARTLVHGRVKLCGLTRADDVALAAKRGATHAGFVMVPGSPRAIDEGQAARLAPAARAQGLKAIGVFRNAAPAAVAKAATTLQLDAVQLHGDENHVAVANLRSRLPGTTEIWALCGVANQAAPRRRGADRSLFDTLRNGASGGTGVSFDWRLLIGRADLPDAFIAGGIGPANARAAASLGAYGIDVGSGVEAAPGIKDAAKVDALFAALRPDARSSS
jgi:indole-3-glycerol phosphate synthase/phosphoribosylanthranilate isomerase